MTNPIYSSPVGDYPLTQFFDHTLGMYVGNCGTGTISWPSWPIGYTWNYPIPLGGEASSASSHGTITLLDPHMRTISYNGTAGQLTGLISSDYTTIEWSNNSIWQRPPYIQR